MRSIRWVISVLWLLLFIQGGVSAASLEEAEKALNRGEFSRAIEIYRVLEQEADVSHGYAYEIGSAYDAWSVALYRNGLDLGARSAAQMASQYYDRAIGEAVVPEKNLETIKIRLAKALMRAREYGRAESVLRETGQNRADYDHLLGLALVGRALVAYSLGEIVQEEWLNEARFLFERAVRTNIWDIPVPYAFCFLAVNESNEGNSELSAIYVRQWHLQENERDESLLPRTWMDMIGSIMNADFAGVCGPSTPQATSPSI